MRYTLRSARHALLLLPLTAMLVGGCSGSGKPKGDIEDEFPRVGGRSSIFLDGDISDWPSEIVAWSDPYHLYLRFSVENEEFTLQSSPVSVSIYLDADGNASTGTILNEKEPFKSLGADIEIQFSPQRSEGVSGRGVMLSALDGEGRRTPLDTYTWDFTCSPTYAASWYEARISRTPATAAGLPQAGFLSEGALRGVVTISDQYSNLLGYSEPFRCSMPRAAASPRLAVLYPPRKPDGGFRVVSYNVLRTSPVKNPRPFQRIFSVLDPDVVLLQEWECDSPGDIEQWFNTMLPDTKRRWRAAALPGSVSDGGGVAIVSRLPLEAMSDSEIYAAGAGADSSRRVRFVSAAIDTRPGILLVASTHLKCCGTKDSPEDKTRMAEARVINAYLQEQITKYPEAIRVIGGDLNLVGSRPPLDILRARLDADGSDLEVASPLALGDRSMATWSEKGNEFAPGRLDYVLYSGANVKVSRAFVLDTGRLAEASLARIDLQASDSRASDHMPVVVDFVGAR